MSNEYNEQIKDNIRQFVDSLDDYSVVSHFQELSPSRSLEEWDEVRRDDSYRMALCDKLYSNYNHTEDAC
jgi:hypothetical protein